MSDYFERDINERVVIHAHEPRITIIFRRSPQNEHEIFSHDEARELIEALQASMRQFPEVDARQKELHGILQNLHNSEAALVKAYRDIDDMDYGADVKPLHAALKEVQLYIRSIKNELGAQDE